MTNYTTNFFLILLIIASSTILYSQPRYGNQINVKVNAKIELHKKYLYNYKVKILDKSTQVLVAFTVEIEARNKNDIETLTIHNSINKNWGGSISFPIVKPVSFKGAEITWVPLDTLESYPDQFFKPKSSINQGDSINFSFETNGLPIIAKFWALGWYKPITVSEYDSLKSIGFEESDILKPWYLNAKQGYTVSSSVIPKPFIFIEFIDTLTTYTDSSNALGWIKTEQTKDKYNNYFTNAKNYLNQNNNNAAKTELQKILTDCNADSSTVLTSEAYALLYFNTDYLIKQIPEGKPGLPVKLEDSQGNLLQGGSLQYYDGGWKDAIDNGDGTFTVQTEKSTVSLKMHYAGGYQQKDNVTVGPDTAVFQTVNTTVKLLNSQGAAIDTGTVKYYASGWKDLGTTVNGIAEKELLPRKYTFQMSYAGASINKDQDISQNPVVVFQTVRAEVQLKDSQGNLLDSGTVKYYASGWKDFGTAANGSAAKELLPKKYTFQMKYGGASINKDQDISQDSVVVFQTVNAEAQLKDSQGNLLDGGTVKYYASGWKDFGSAANGSVTKELLPKKYTFQMSYAGASINKDQDISQNPVVVFQTVKAEVQLKDSQGNLLPVPSGDGGTVKYYASGWKDFGTAANGSVTKELLPKQYTFQMSYAGASINKDQDISQDSVVVFQTVNAEVQLKDSQGNLLDGGTVKYYASGWKDFGTAANGTVTKELLPKKYTFQMSYAGASINKDQDISQDPVVVFQTVKAEVQLKDSQGNLLDDGTVKYYASGWKDFGTAANGTVAKELLPKQYTFQMSYAGIANNKDQDVSANGMVIFTTVNTTVKVTDSNNQPIDGAEVSYYGSGWKTIGTTVNGEVTKELLPKQITFKAKYNSKQAQKDQDISANNIVEINIE